MFELEKPDALTHLHHSKQLIDVLSFYEKILLHKIADKLPDDDFNNEKLYLPFLKEYREELTFYEHNLRTHYQ